MKRSLIAWVALVVAIHIPQNVSAQGILILQCDASKNGEMVVLGVTAAGATSATVGMNCAAAIARGAS